MLPSNFPADAFEKIMAVMEDKGHIEQVVLLSKWYHNDENAIPNQYKLQPINSLIPNFLSSNPELQHAAEKEWLETVELLEGSLSMASEGHMGEHWRETYVHPPSFSPFMLAPTHSFFVLQVPD